MYSQHHGTERKNSNKQFKFHINHHCRNRNKATMTATTTYLTNYYWSEIQAEKLDVIFKKMQSL